MTIIAKARVAQLNGFSPITAATELSAAFENCFYRWKARLLGGRGSSSAQRDGGRVRTPAPTKKGDRSEISVGAGPRPARGRTMCAPTAENSLGTLVRKRQAQKRNRTNSNFPQTQGPVARRELRVPLRFCAPELFCPLQGVTPVKWGPGKGDYEHEVLIGAVPGGVLPTLPPWAK